MRRLRKTKIVATLGPASESPEMLRALFEAGTDVFRLNFSHGSHQGHGASIEAIRTLEAMSGRPIGILADLQGPKLRIGTFSGGPVTLVEGARFRLSLADEPGDESRVALPHAEIFAALEVGTEVLIDDGRVRLRVETAAPESAETVVVAGGVLSDHKGVNIPKATLALAPLTDKDLDDLQFAIDHGVDWIGLSFVQRPDDIADARKLIAGRAAVLAKLERPAAITRLDEIVESADAIMVARGDLGVELPVEEVPGLQKRIIRAARAMGKPVVVATQMLDSMVRAPLPTRAEVSDVATAVYDGADAVMLSAESATGEHPLGAVRMMNRIVEQVEHDPLYLRIMEAEHPELQATGADAITAAARQVAETVAAAAIVTYTTSGSTALRAARERPPVPILGLVPNLATARRLALVWGVHCVHTEDAKDFSDMVEKACRVALAEGFAEKGGRLVVTAGVPFGTPGATNTLRIAWV